MSAVILVVLEGNGREKKTSRLKMTQGHHRHGEEERRKEGGGEMRSLIAMRIKYFREGVKECGLKRWSNVEPSRPVLPYLTP